MNAVELQIAFLKQIKNVLPQHLALVDALAEQLNISNDFTIKYESPFHPLHRRKKRIN